MEILQGWLKKQEFKDILQVQTGLPCCGRNQNFFPKSNREEYNIHMAAWFIIQEVYHGYRLN